MLITTLFSIALTGEIFAAPNLSVALMGYGRPLFLLESDSKRSFAREAELFLQTPWTKPQDRRTLRALHSSTASVKAVTPYRGVTCGRRVPTRGTQL